MPTATASIDAAVLSATTAQTDADAAILAAATAQASIDTFVDELIIYGPYASARFAAEFTTPAGVVSVPISSWQATLSTGTSNYAVCVIPAAAQYADTIDVATEFSIRWTLFDAAGAALYEGVILTAPVQTVTYDRGPRNFTATVSGYWAAYTAVAHPNPVYDRTLSGVRSTSTTGAQQRVRCSLDFALRPAQRAFLDGEALIVSRISYYASDAQAYTDVTGSAEAIADGGASDPYFANVVLLMHCEGADESTTFVDSSSKAKTLNSVNGAKQSTAQAKFGSSSATFPSSAYVQAGATNDADFSFGADDFTVECWIYGTALSGFQLLFHFASGYSPSQASWDVDQNSGYFEGEVYSGSTPYYTSGAGVTVNTWHHVALVRDTNTLRAFIDGTEVSTYDVTGITVQSPSGRYLAIGGSIGGTDNFAGYIDEIRITAGVARYTTNFTPPDAQFPDE